MVVIGIMALLAALVVAGVGQVRIAQMGENTDQTVVKLQQALDTQWRVVVEQARDDVKKKKVPPLVMQFCGNDEERAEALWVYINLKRELPQSFAEFACPNPAQLAGTAPFSTPDTRRGVWLWYPAQPTTAAVLILPARATFNEFPITGTGAPEEAAVLLYKNLSEKGNKGVTFAIDDVTQSAQGNVMVGGVNHRVVQDAWGTPVFFLRFADYDDLQAPPYVDAGTASSATASRDKIDQLGKLANAPAPGPGIVWDTGRKSAAETMVGTSFNLRNKRITVIAAGSDKVFSNNPLDGDDHYGYRLVKQGNRGD
jgi:hypothetical protein